MILVDSGSTDGTLDIARNYGVDDIVFIDPEEFSFGRALNHGCMAASGTFCVIASAHVYPKRKNWLEKLIEKFNDDDIALVYGKQRGNRVTTFSENQIFKQWFPEHDIKYQTHPFCNNANAAIRRELWEEYPYDEELAGLEDVAWAKRIQEVGYEIFYASEAEIIHVHDESIREVYNRYRREGYAHKQIMPDHSFSFLDFFRLSCLHILSDYHAAINEGDFWTNLMAIPKFRLLQFGGTYHGFSQEGMISEGLWQRFYYPDRDTFPGRSDDNQPLIDDSIDIKSPIDDDPEDADANEIEYPDSNEFADIVSQSVS